MAPKVGAGYSRVLSRLTNTDLISLITKTDKVKQSPQAQDDAKHASGAQTERRGGKITLSSSSTILPAIVQPH